MQLAALPTGAPRPGDPVIGAAVGAVRRYAPRSPSLISTTDTPRRSARSASTPHCASVMPRTIASPPPGTSRSYAARSSMNSSSSMLGTKRSTRGSTRSRNAFQSTRPDSLAGSGRLMSSDASAPRARARSNRRARPDAAVGEDAPHQGRVTEVEDAGAVEHRFVHVLPREGVVRPGAVVEDPVDTRGIEHDGVRAGLAGHHADAPRQLTAPARHPLQDEGSDRVVADAGHEARGHAEAVQAESRVGHRAARADGRRPDVERGARAGSSPRVTPRGGRVKTGDDVYAEVAAGHDRAVTISRRHRLRIVPRSMRVRKPRGAGPHGTSRACGHGPAVLLRVAHDQRVELVEQARVRRERPVKEILHLVVRFPARDRRPGARAAGACRHRRRRQAAGTRTGESSPRSRAPRPIRRAGRRGPVAGPAPGRGRTPRARRACAP